ncbi:MAG: hypothetical protein V7761_00800, partial [Amylibacter sp.]
DGLDHPHWPGYVSGDGVSLDGAHLGVGSEGGDGGGQIVAVGTPEQVAEVKGSYTGHYLKDMLKARKVAAE